MTLNWADTERSDKFWSSGVEEQRTITIIQDLLDESIDPESAAHDIAKTYEPLLLQGEKISYHPFTLLSHAIVYPTTTLENHEHIVQMLLHLSELPTVVIDGLLGCTSQLQLLVLRTRSTLVSIPCPPLSYLVN
jgi:hypothetical protein